MKNKTIMLIVLISLAVFIIFGVTSCILSSLYVRNHDGFQFDYNFEKTNADQQAEISLEGINAIEITTIASDVVFSTSDDLLTSKLYIISSRQQPEITLSSYIEGTTAYIEVVYPQPSVHILRSRLSVGIPSDFSGEVSVKTTSGDVKGDLPNRFSAFSMSTMSGDLSLSTTGAEDVVFDSISGDMSFTADISDSVSAVSKSGEIKLGDLIEDNADVYVETTSGGVRLNYSAACATTIKTISGDIHVALPKDTPIQLSFSSYSRRLLWKR